MVYTLIEGDANSMVDASHPSPWKLISQGYASFRSLISLDLGDGSRIKFWEDLVVGNNTLSEIRCISETSLALYQSILHNAPIIQFYSSFEFNMSQNFHFLEIQIIGNSLNLNIFWSH